MSAFLVSKAHIDYLVHAAITLNARPHLGCIPFHGEYVSAATSNDVGRALWFTNVASVLYRYPDCDIHRGDLPGPVGIDHESIVTYACPVFPEKRFDVVTALKALDCYEHQSCEHPGWRESAAFAFIDRLRGALIRALPDYDQAPWEIDAETTITALAA